MNLFRNLFIFILVLKLVVSNGDVENDTEKGADFDKQTNSKVKMPVSEEIGTKKKDSKNTVNQTGNKSVSVENSVKSDIQDPEQAVANNPPLTEVEAPRPHIPSKTIDVTPSILLEESEIDSNSDEENYKKFRDRNAQIIFPNASQPSTKQNSDNPDLPITKVKENQTEAILTKLEHQPPSSTPRANNIEKNSDQLSRVTNSKSVPNLHAENKVSPTTTPSSPDPPKIVKHDLDHNDRSKQNTQNPLIASNQQNSEQGSKIPPNDSSLNHSDKIDTVAELDSQRTEKSLRMATTDNVDSLVNPTSPNLPENKSNQNPNVGEQEISDKKEGDAQPILKNMSPEVTKTATTPSAPNTPTTLGNVNPQIANSSKPNLSKVSELQTSSNTVDNLRTETPRRDTPARTPSSPPFTTTFFRAVNSPNEIENGTVENDSEAGEHDHGKTVVTDKTLVGQPIMEDTDLTTVGHDANLTENSPNAPMTDDDTVQRGNATSANSEKDSNPRIVFPDSITSPATHTKSPSMEIGTKAKEKEPFYSSETPTSTTPTSNSTEWTNATGMPPVNTTANENGQTITVQQFFSQLKMHTVLCIISIALILLTLTVIVSLVIVIYYLFKYFIIALINLCKRMGGCGKSKKNLGSIPEGSLFPRCDVNVSPYIQNANLRNSRNHLDTEMYS